VKATLGEWTEKALCAQVGGDVFYPEQGELVERAKAVCRACEVRVPCLAYALEISDRDGIFGGFTERIRLKIAREHRAGRPLEDIIAEDDAAFYARIERSAELAEAAAERKRASAKRSYYAIQAARQREQAA
jgi:WhiB family transcriptional regulator, redox-sensing transcriptional regulator